MSDVFNTQPANEVFASPDGSSGEPGFRKLTANDVPNQLQAVFANTLTYGGNTAYIANVFLPANSISNGASFKLLAWNYYAGSTSMYPFRVVLGANGNVSDPILFQDNQYNLNNSYDITVCFLTTGQNGNVAIMSHNHSQDVSYLGPPLFQNVNTQQNLYLGMVFSSAASTDGNTEFMTIIKQLV